MTTAERRQFERIATHKPCKVYDPALDRFVAGSTCNLSDGGALLELNRPLGAAEASPRPPVFIGIPLESSDGWIKSDELIESEVCRAVRAPDGRFVVALRFIRPQQFCNVSPLKAA